MTYCLGMLLEEGLIMMADTRTNAGIDNFSSYKKLHTLADGADRQIFVCSSGSLSMSQTIISLLNEGLTSSETADLPRSVREAASMFRVAQLVGEAVQLANQTVGSALTSIGIESSVELLLGGRIGDQPLCLFLIYSAGNFIECTAEVPFLQVGETKYGRPILDRTLGYQSPLREAVKVALLSFDSSMQSNLGVARPIDIIVLSRQEEGAVISRRINQEDVYFDDLSRRWANDLKTAVLRLPAPPWIPN